MMPSATAALHASDRTVWVRAAVAGDLPWDAFRGVSFEAVAFDEAYVGGFEPVHAYGADDGGDVVFDAEPV